MDLVGSTFCAYQDPLGFEGKRSQQQERVCVKETNPLICNHAPKALAINCYDPGWFNEQSESQKHVIADSFYVTFLPNAAHSIRGKKHLDEKLGDLSFNDKYWDIITKLYYLSHKIEPEEEILQNDDEESIDLDELKDESGGKGGEEFSERNGIRQRNGTCGGSICHSS
ncbi:hypothetical protein O181_128152 [Austropuccinia psidii MF-1]|uniref:Uncharacterized protein n=1 Tax=Austropuccinia psidii MF-1 TaxID=1389203 RepID=A0A9Q3KZA6_9BASI|nr:hypothetical protein [Austropuccinia psidii MF-1]